MSISSKTRKLLWGKSGNRCAICKKELVIERTSNDNESVVGDECHIISPHSNGPRHVSGCNGEWIDSFDNLILLCKVHHKMVDDQCETFTKELLQRIKFDHHKWVRERLTEHEECKPLRIKRIKENIPEYLNRITSGKEVVNLMHNVMAYDFDYDDLESSEEVDLVSEFFAEVQNVGDLMDVLETGDRVQEAYRMTKYIKEIESKGFLLFGGYERQILEGGIGNKQSYWNLVFLRVVRPENELIKPVDSE